MPHTAALPTRPLETSQGPVLTSWTVVSAQAAGPALSAACPWWSPPGRVLSEERWPSMLSRCGLGVPNAPRSQSGVPGPGAPTPSPGRGPPSCWSLRDRPGKVCRGVPLPEQAGGQRGASCGDGAKAQYLRGACPWGPTAPGVSMSRSAACMPLWRRACGCPPCSVLSLPFPSALASQGAWCPCQTA